MNIETTDLLVTNIDVTNDWKISDVINCVANKIDLWQTSFFYLRVVGLNGLGSWLDPEYTVKDCKLEHSSKLELKVKFFRKPKKLVDPKARFLFLKQITNYLLNGYYECAENVLFMLIGYQLKIEKGDFVKGKQRRGFLMEELSHYVPKVYFNIYHPTYLERRLFNNWEKVSVHETTKDEAIDIYHTLARKNFAMYGTEIFNITSLELNKLSQKILAISCDGFFLSCVSKLKLSFFQLDKAQKDLTTWEYTPYSDIKEIVPTAQQITINTENKSYIIKGANIVLRQIVELISGYIIIMGNNKIKIPVVPHIPEPSSFARELDRPKDGYPVKKSRLELFKDNYYDLCKQDNLIQNSDILEQVDIAFDFDENLVKLDLSDLRLSSKAFSVFIHAMKETAQFKTNDENFIENMPLTYLDLTNLPLTEKDLAYFNN